MKNSSILIASKSYYVRMKVRKALEGWKWEMLEAEDGSEVMKIFKVARPGLVILDIVLPEMDGFDLASQILNLEPEAGIIVFGSWDDKQTCEKLKLEISFLEKPVNLKNLVHISSELTRTKMR